MSANFVLILCSLLSGLADTYSTYDQSQTGDFNVQVDLKNLRIIALMNGGKEEYMDYDYAYDYSEMTIKPQNGTTPKPLNVTSTTADIVKDTIITTTPLIEQTTTLTKNTTSLSSEDVEVASNITIESTTTVKSVFEMITTEAPIPSHYKNSTLNTIIWNSFKNVTLFPPSSNRTECKKGYILNQKGDCEFKLQESGNALLKLLELSQKLKFRRENRRN